MIFIETPIFTRQIQALVEDAEYQEFQQELVRNPAAGNLIPRGGGIRKIRIRLAGRGKRSGGRIVYYWAKERSRVYLLSAYAKNVQTAMSDQQLKVLCDLVEELK